jgi:hypothetical protein
MASTCFAPPQHSSGTLLMRLQVGDTTSNIDLADLSPSKAISAPDLTSAHHLAQ